MNDVEIEFWLDLSDKIALKVENAINNAGADPDLNSITKIGADGTPTHKIDEYAEEVAIKMLRDSKKTMILISEEIGAIDIGYDKPEYVVIMDPLDGTSNAMKNIPCYGLSIAVAPLGEDETIEDITVENIEVGYVKNFPTGDVYSAVKDKGATKNNKPMSVSTITKVDHATLSTYIYRQDPRKLDKLLSTVRRMRLMGAIAIELCYVADGTYDIFLDTNAVRVLDIAASQLIIKENGGVITDCESKKMTSQLDILETTSILATSNEEIHSDTIRLLD